MVNNPSSLASIFPLLHDDHGQLLHLDHGDVAEGD